MHPTVVIWVTRKSVRPPRRSLEVPPASRDAAWHDRNSVCRMADIPGHNEGEVPIGPDQRVEFDVAYEGTPLGYRTPAASVLSPRQVGSLLGRAEWPNSVLMSLGSTHAEGHQTGRGEGPGARAPSSFIVGDALEHQSRNELWATNPFSPIPRRGCGRTWASARPGG